MRVQIAGNWNRGMGTQICALSTFMHANVTTIEVGHMRDFNSFNEYKKIFEIDSLEIVYIDDGIPNGLFAEDCFKLFSPYFKKRRNNKIKRPFIGMACYDNKESVFNCSNQDFSYPKNKFQPIEIYARIYSQIKSAGYDIITFDSKEISRIDKAQIIENFCECVIGYEGGISHLCHMLDTPYIMIPWNRSSGLEQIIHLDNKTYFLNNVQEFFTWDSNQLTNVIEQLNREQGNNKFLFGEETINVDENFIITDKRGNQIPIYFNDLEKKFFVENFKNKALAGK